jgi:hypothetical protein
VGIVELTKGVRMYVLKSENPEGGNNVTIYKTRSECQSLYEGWLEIANGRYPVTIRRVPKMEALNEYANYLVEDIRYRKAMSNDEGVKIALNHVVCNLFKLQDSTKGER